MNLTQFLIFEICAECHRGHEHAWCPNRHPERFACSAGRRPVTDDQIMAIVAEAYGRHGFRGLVGWHYYNEPLAAWWRLKPLLARLKAEVPGFGSVLWTNGDQLPTDLRDLDAFASIHVTDYAGRCAAPGARVQSRARVWKPTPDGRLNPPQREGRAPCRRPFVEMIVDFYGNVHPCCYDWRGCVELGNVHDAPFAEIVARWQMFREAVSGETMTAAAPEACRRCSMRNVSIPDFVPEVAAAARRSRHEAPGIPDGRTARVPSLGTGPFVVAVAYRIPEHRVRDFCTWNNAAFRTHGVRVVLVVEEPYLALPNYVRQVRYTVPMAKFSLACTKNAAIAAALDAGADVIVASDIDVVFPPETLAELCTVGKCQASVPLYRMASDYEHRASAYVDAPRATGTIAMRAADWRAIRYDERCEGYGSEDAIILRDVDRAGIQIVDRQRIVYHIAHQPGTPQKEFAGRCDHWGRGNGFNPENFAGNRRYFLERRCAR